jgi:hypothetical protein
MQVPVSNYDWETLPGFDVSVGAEIVNGTGQVRINAHQGEDTVILTMPAERALDFARLLSQQAHEAMRAKWNEANILSG